MKLKSPFASDCLQDRTVLITGGCGAIGRVVVDHLLAHGAVVAVNDVLDDAAAAGVLPKHIGLHYVRADITDEADVTGMFDRVTAWMGRPNTVLCHAGVAVMAATVEHTLAQWNHVLGINLTGAFLVAREAARRMGTGHRLDNPCRIIFTSSWIQDVPWPNQAAYNASKGGLEMLMRSMARELAASKILVNAVAPGIVGVGMAKKQWDEDPAFRARTDLAIPLGSLQKPESVAQALVVLCSEAASYVTGQTLVVDGGCSLYPLI